MNAMDLARRAQELFGMLLEVDAEQRAALLHAACADDPALRLEVEELLAAYRGARTEEVLPPIFHAPPAWLVAGEHIGPYRIVKEIARGGMGAVFLAERDDVGMRVALKLVRDGRLASPEHVRRFLRERRLLARLEHPGIARLLDVGVTREGIPYLVMEYVEGEPIDRFCDHHRLTVAERLRLIQDVCRAVEFAHRNLVVHRDLKPSNILVTPDGQVKLLDFGIAKLLLDDGDEGEMTRTGMVLLTPEYASPEQIRGEPVTTASDVYSLGVLLYELLCGRRPYPASSASTPGSRSLASETVPMRPSSAVRQPAEDGRIGDRAGRESPDALGEARRTPLARLYRELQGDLDTIVLQALRYEPERRYSTVRELREDIERHVTGLPVQVRGDSASYRARKFVRRHRMGIAAGGLVLLSLAGGMVATALQARRAEAERALAEERLRDVRELTGTLLFDVHDAIQELPGSTPARQLLAERGVAYLDRLTEQAGDDRDLLRDLAAAYVKLGMVQGYPANANTGDLAGARESFLKALSIAQRLVEEDAGNRPALRSLALANEKLGDVEAWTGNPERGVAHAREALRHWRSLADAQPGSASPWLAVVISHVKLGDLLGHPSFPNLGDAAGALAEYREASARLEGIPADSARTLAVRRYDGVVHERLGAMLRQQGRHAEAREALQRSLRTREALARENAASTDLLRDVGVAHQNLCELFREEGSPAEGVESCRRALAVYRDLHAADPANAQSRADLSVGRRALALALAAQGDPSSAVAELERGIAQRDTLLLANPDDAANRRELGRDLIRLGILYADLAGHDPQRSAEHLRRAALHARRGRELLGDAASASPDDRALVEEANVRLGVR